MRLGVAFSPPNFALEVGGYEVAKASSSREKMCVRIEWPSFSLTEPKWVYMTNSVTKESVG